MDAKPKYSIFVVDDIIENIQVISTILAQERYNLMFAENGKDALKSITAKLPDLILLDVNMPELSGFEVCTLLKSNESTKDIPIIFLTAQSQTDDIVYGLKLGAVDYITKPFHSEELLSRVRTHINLKKAQDLIKNQNQELEISNNKLLDLNATKDKFFRIIAHDLKNPISQVLSFTGALEENFEEYSREEILEFVKLLGSSASKSMKLLDNLLEWARSQSGSISFRPENILLASVINENINLFIPSTQAKQITINLQIEEGLQLLADRNMLLTIIRNLISNAIKFTHQGGTITITAKNQQKNIEILVIDSGIGIPKDKLSQLFRIDSHYSTLGTDMEQGTGLGLILCKEFIGKHHGTITVESEVGQGSTFKIILPMQL